MMRLFKRIFSRKPRIDISSVVKIKRKSLNLAIQFNKKKDIDKYNYYMGRVSLAEELLNGKG